MKPILHITWEYPPFVVGGLSQELRKTLPPLAKKLPLLLVVRAGSDGDSDLDGMHIYRVAQSVATSPHVLTFGYTLNVDLVRGASRAMYESKGVTLVHCHDWISALSGVFLKANFGIPLVISVYSTELSRSRAINNLLSMGIFDVEKHCFQAADALVTDHGLKQGLVDNYGIKPGKIFDKETDLLELYSRWAC